MARVFNSIAMRWRHMLRRHRTRRNSILVLHQLNGHMLRDIGLHEPRSPDDP